ncbi:ATP-binding protein, partial [uncultured Parasutterella sp.]|uniref:ATP-binding protein n=1 Tax=uncultured Parasutterella sp. TaxID=1263098 RepID=UPI002609D265
GSVLIIAYHPPFVQSFLKVPLTSTKENGMGLGLTIVKTIVEAHQGKICFKRNSDVGLTVTVSFPLAKDGFACQTQK